MEKWFSFCLAAAAGGASAQQYPSKTVRIMAAALTELWGAQVVVENRPGAAGNIATEITAKAGRVRALGVTLAKRNAQVPDVPTFAEQGVKDSDVTGWYGLCTQSKVPPAIIAKLNADGNKLLTGATLKKRLEDQGISLSPTTPEAFVAHVTSEIDKWTKVVQEAKLPGE